jgi:hypothetical protein
MRFQVVDTTFKQEQPVGETPRPISLSSKEEEGELARGNKLVNGGDIGTARLIFQNLALRGSVPAARHLAETYDPQFLRRMAVAGLQPHLDTARKWYRIDAGDSEALIRLNVLARQWAAQDEVNGKQLSRVSSADLTIVHMVESPEVAHKTTATPV